MIGDLANHLWQSTVFALVAGLITVGFRGNRAHVRYCLWLSASVKFLLPFSLLIGLGNRLEWTPVARNIVAAPSITLTVVQMSQPFPRPLPLTPSVRRASNWTAVAIAGVWAFGFSGVVLIRYRGWRRIRAAVRSSSAIDVLENVQVRSSPGLLEPGVVGLFRPILLLPADIAQRLPPPQFEAVLQHEMCHVRRRDNVTSAMHMIVETVFWFHPLVWWIGARLIEERERACDEAVLTHGNDPRDYAGGILNVCKSYLESPLSFVSGVTGSNLKRRIQLILTGRVTRKLTFAKKVALAVAAAAAITIPIAIGIIGAPRTQAQSQTSAPKFETASIQPCNAFRKGTVQDWSSGRLHSECTTVQRLIQQAYGLFADGHMNPGSSLSVAGGPAWTASDLYQIDAKAHRPRSHSTMNGPMLQALLEDRFKLKLHRETREVAIYALTVGAGGSKLQPFQGSCTPRDFDNPPSAADCGTARFYGNGFDMKAATIADLCTGFSVFLNRPVVDQTGLTGRFNMHLDLSSEGGKLLNLPRSLLAVSDPSAPAPPPVPFDAAKTAIEKLGLNLEPTTGPGEFLVIDRIDRPSP
jgi:uncharacterized protein (TIGR03435 family)